MSFIAVYDGIDGSGKGLVEATIIAQAEKHNLSYFHLEQFQKKHNRHPTPQEIKDSGANIIISAEPTFVGIGKDIRERLIANNSGNYTVNDHIPAFANDRHYLYKNILLPLFNDGIPIFQSRGYTSAIYQAIQKAQLDTHNDNPSKEDIIKSVHVVLAEDGNQWCIQNATIHYLLLLVPQSAQQTMQRISSREKNDNCVFEKLDFQTLLLQGYTSTEYQKILKENGTDTITINTGEKIEQTQQQVEQIFTELMQKYNLLPTTTQEEH